jgi:hypothetical protein
MRFAELQRMRATGPEMQFIRKQMAELAPAPRELD